ncbi:MAG: hypothetical protein ACRCUY_06230 [Thermoguttaceae bacterium]
MDAQHFLTLLEEKKLLSSEMIRGLRERLDSLDENVSAADFANRLVQNGVITASLSQAMLRQVDKQNTDIPATTNLSATIHSANSSTSHQQTSVSPSITPPPVDSSFSASITHSPPPPLPFQVSTSDKKTKPSSPNPPTFSPQFHAPSASPNRVELAKKFVTEKKDATKPNEAVSPLILTENGDTHSILTSQTSSALKRVRERTKQKSRWDSNLILFGFGVVLVIVLLGLFLTGSLFRHSAEKMRDAANHDYETGSYSEAIQKFTAFIDTFPNHVDVSHSKIRRSLAKIRHLIDSKADWFLVLETAESELELIENEPDFFSESKSELALLLPRIASGLANEASQQNSIVLAEYADRAVQLSESHVPTSLCDVKQLTEARGLVLSIRRRFQKDDVFKETSDFVTKVEITPKNIATIYEKLDSLLSTYPELRKEPKTDALFKQISEKEASAISVIPSDLFPKFSILKNIETENISVSNDSAETAHELAVFFHRPVSETISVDNSIPICFYAAGNLYAVRASDGTLMWTKKIDTKITDPIIIPIQENKIATRSTLPQSTFLFGDVTSSGFLECRDSLTGSPIWHLPINESFSVSQIESNVILSTESGRIFALDLNVQDFTSPKIVCGFQLPQKAAFAPCLDEMQNLFQLAHRNTIYKIPLSALLNGEIDKTTSFYTGHIPASIRVEPISFQKHQIIISQNGPASCDMIVLASDGKIVQQIPIDGLIDVPPVIQSQFIAVATDSGQLSLWEQSPNYMEDDRKNEKEPLRKIASGVFRDSQKKRIMKRFVAFPNDSLWMADEKIVSFEPQLTQSRLTAKKITRTNLITLSSLQQIGEFLFHVARIPETGAISVAALDIKNSEIKWETILAEPLIQAKTGADENHLIVYTSGGNAFSVPIHDEHELTNNSKFSDTSYIGIPFAYLPRGSFGKKQLANILCFENGIEVWIPEINSYEKMSKQSSDDDLTTLYFYNPKESPTFRFRTMTFAAAATPIIFDKYLLVPLVDGSIVLVDPIQTKIAGKPFFPGVSSDGPALWNQPAISETSPNTAVISDLRRGNNGITNYEIMLEHSESGTPEMILAQKKSQLIPSISKDEQSNTKQIKVGTRLFHLGENGTLYEIKNKN